MNKYKLRQKTGCSSRTLAVDGCVFVAIGFAECLAVIERQHYTNNLGWPGGRCWSKVTSEQQFYCTSSQRRKIVDFPKKRQQQVIIIITITIMIIVIVIIIGNALY